MASFVAAALAVVPAPSARAGGELTDANPRNPGIVLDWYAGVSASCSKIAYYINNQMLCLENGTVWVYSTPAGGADVQATKSVLPGSQSLHVGAIATRPDGGVYAWESNTHQLFLVLNGGVTHLAGDGGYQYTRAWSGPATQDSLGNVTAITLGINGQVYMLDDGIDAVMTYRESTTYDSSGTSTSTGWIEPFAPGVGDLLNTGISKSSMDIDQSGIAWIGGSGNKLVKLNPGDTNGTVVSDGTGSLSPGSGNAVGSVTFPGVFDVSEGAGQTTYVASGSAVYAVAADGKTLRAAGGGSTALNLIRQNSQSHLINMSPRALTYSNDRGLAIYDSNSQRIWLTNPAPTPQSQTPWSITPLFRSYSTSSNLFKVEKQKSGPGGFSVFLPAKFTVAETKLVNPSGNRNDPPLCTFAKQNNVRVLVPDVNGFLTWFTGNKITCKVSNTSAAPGTWVLTLASLDPNNPGTEADFAPANAYEGLRSISVASGGTTLEDDWVATPFSWNQTLSNPVAAPFVSIDSNIPTHLGPGSAVKACNPSDGTCSVTIANYGSGATDANMTLTNIIPDGMINVSIAPDSASASTYGVTCDTSKCTIANPLPALTRDATNVNINKQLTVAQVKINVGFVVPIDIVGTKAGLSASGLPAANWSVNSVRTVTEVPSSRSWQDPNQWSFATAKGPLPLISAVTSLTDNGHPQVVADHAFSVTVPITNSGGADFEPRSLPVGVNPTLSVDLPDGASMLMSGSVVNSKSATVGTCVQSGAKAVCTISSPFNFNKGDTVTAKLRVKVTKQTTPGFQNTPAVFKFAAFTSALASGTLEVLDPTKPYIRVDAYTQPDITKDEWAVANKIESYAGQVNRVMLRVDSVGDVVLPQGSTFTATATLPAGAQYRAFNHGVGTGTWALQGSAPSYPDGDAALTHVSTVTFLGTVTDPDGLQTDESFPDLFVDVMQLDNRDQVKQPVLGVAMTASMVATPANVQVNAPALSERWNVNAPQAKAVLVPNLAPGHGLIRGQEGSVTFSIQNTSGDRIGIDPTAVLTIPKGITVLSADYPGSTWLSDVAPQTDGTTKISLSTTSDIPVGATTSTVEVKLKVDPAMSQGFADVGYSITDYAAAANEIIDVGDPLAPSAGTDQVVQAISNVSASDGSSKRAPTVVTLDASTSSGGFRDQPLNYQWEQLCIGAQNPDASEQQECSGRTDPAVVWSPSTSPARPDVKTMAKPTFTAPTVVRPKQLAFRVTVSSMDVTAKAITRVMVDVEPPTEFADGVTSPACEILTAGRFRTADAAIGPVGGRWQLSTVGAQVTVTGDHCTDAGVKMDFTGAQVVLDGGITVENASGTATADHIAITGGGVHWAARSVGDLPVGDADNPSMRLAYDGSLTGGTVDGASPLDVGGAVQGGTAHMVISGTGDQVADLTITGATIAADLRADLHSTIKRDGSYSFTVSNGAGAIPVVGGDVASVTGSVSAVAPALTPVIDITASRSGNLDLVSQTVISGLKAAITGSGIAFSGTVETFTGRPSVLRFPVASGVGTDVWTLSAGDPAAGMSFRIGPDGTPAVPVTGASGSVGLTRPPTGSAVWSVPSFQLALDPSDQTIKKPASEDLAFGDLSVVVGADGPSLGGHLKDAPLGMGKSLELQLLSAGDQTLAVGGGVGAKIAPAGLSGQQVGVTSVVGTVAPAACPGTDCGSWLADYRVVTDGSLKWGDVSVTGISAAFDAAGGQTHATATLLFLPDLVLPTSYNGSAWVMDGAVDWTSSALMHGADPMQFTGAAGTGGALALTGIRSGSGSPGRNKLDVRSMNVSINQGQVQAIYSGLFGTTLLGGTVSFTAVVSFKGASPTIVSTAGAGTHDAALRSALTAALTGSTSAASDIKPMPDQPSPAPSEPTAPPTPATPPTPVAPATPSAPASPSPLEPGSPSSPGPSGTVLAAPSLSPAAYYRAGGAGGPTILAAAAPLATTSAASATDAFCVAWLAVGAQTAVAGSITVDKYVIPLNSTVSAKGSSCNAADAAIAGTAAQITAGVLKFSGVNFSLTREHLTISTATIALPSSWKVKPLTVSSPVVIPLDNQLVCNAARSGTAGGDD
ncbi:MAG: hypothetical protein WCP28_07410, partial [Actinomycetes bacterium]